MCALTCNYVCLVTQFKDMASGVYQDISGDDQAKVKGYLKQMTMHKFVLYLASYHDLLEDMAKLSLSLQNDAMPLSAV